MLELLEALDTFLSEAGKAEKLRVIEKAEVKIKRLMSRVFTSQGKDVLKALAKYEGTFPIEESLTPEELKRILEALEGYEKEIAEGTEAAMAPAMKAARAQLLAKIGDVAGVSFELSNPKATKWLQEYAVKLGKDVTATTTTEIKGILTQSVDEGWSYARTSKAIRDQFDGFAGKMPQAHIRNRAEGIAVTESRRAYEQGNLLTAKELKDAGLDMVKSWLAEADACDICLQNESDNWIDIDDSFISGDDTPPAHPYCRCDMLTQRKGAGE